MKYLKMTSYFAIPLSALLLSANTQAESENTINDVVVVETPEIDQEELKCLADNIYYESGHEPENGRIAVAAVTLNRVASERFPENICSVVYQRTRRTCQFSWTCMRTRAPNPAVYEESFAIAEKVLTTEINHSNIIPENVMWYHADYVNPGWHNLRRVTKIGRHIFYRDRNG